MSTKVDVLIAPCRDINSVLGRQLSATVERGIAVIASYDFDLIKKKLLKDQVLAEDVVDTAIMEYRKFLILICLGYRGLGMCSQEVDEVWHTHILFTRSYATFCGQAFGFFLHHEPVIGETTTTECYAARSRFLTAYSEAFGRPSVLWNGTHDTECIECEGGSACTTKCVEQIEEIL